jgi:hypothetical protein
MNATTDITVLKQLTAIRLDVSIWSARKKLTPADLGTSDLPPETLTSLGSKKVCDPDDLRIFSTLKARATALLDRHGIRFLGGWAIPESSSYVVVDGLKAIAKDFVAAKEDFLARYDQAVRNWIAQNPGWEKLISDSVVGVDTVRSRLGFGWQMFKVMPPKKGLANDPLRDAVSGLGATLFGDVAKVADEAWHKSFAGKTEVTAKALSPLKALHQKLSGLSFIEPRVTPVLDLLDAAFLTVPERGAISGSNLVMLQGLVCLLRDPDSLLEHGQKIIDGQPPGDALLALVALPSGQKPIPSALQVIEDGGDEEVPAFEPRHEPLPLLDSLGLW